MPFIQVKIGGERDTALAAQAAQRITAITQQHLRKDPALTAVAVELVAPELWFIANASPASQQQLRSFYLNISTKYN
jgi:4-oxalocrotonate tautomerase